MTPQVMLVASEPVLASLLLEVIRGETPAQVIHLPDCDKALTWLRAHRPPTLVLVDTTYPTPAEVSFCTALADHAVWSTVPLLVLADNPEKLVLSARPGLVVLPKPFDLDALLTMVVAHFPVPGLA